MKRIDEKFNISVFEDTLSLCSKKYGVCTGRSYRNTSYYEDPNSEIDVQRNEEKLAPVIFKQAGTIKAAYTAAMNRVNGRIAALDFADALKPGGYPEMGAFTQEENICRCTNLYPILINCKAYFNNNHQCGNHIYTDGTLYIPQIVMFKDDETYEPIGPRVTDIIVCPAPNTAVGDETIYRRAEAIIKVARNELVDTLILGAWGCGAFGQSPEVVARAFAKALNKYGDFKQVIFAIRATVDDWGESNYRRMFTAFVSWYNGDVTDECFRNNSKRQSIEIS